MEFLISFNNQLKIALWIVFYFFGRPTHFNSTRFCCSEKKILLWNWFEKGFWWYSRQKCILWIILLVKITLLTTVEEFEWASAHCLNTCHVELPKKPGYPIHSLLSHKWISCIQHSDICFLLNQLWLPSTSPQSNGHWCGCLSWERSPSTCFHLEAKKYYWASKQIHKWQPSQQWPKRNFTSPFS